MNLSQRPGTPLIFVGNALDYVIAMPLPKNPADRSYDQAHRDVDRIKWFAIGNGGIIEDEIIKLHFEKEEYNSCVRYLGRMNWKQGDVCPTCGALQTENGPVVKAPSTEVCNCY